MKKGIGEVMIQEYRGVKIELKGNILGMWDIYLDGIKQDSSFIYDYSAIDYAKSLIRLGLSKVGN